VNLQTEERNVEHRGRSFLRHDIPASIVVFLVALPLCMGVAIASGVPVSAGLFTGIVAGIVVGSLAGCPLQVSGPAAGLAMIVYAMVQRFGFEMLGFIVLLAGILQMLAGAFRLGQWFRAVSPAVIKGMLAGIGVLILVSQSHVMLDARPTGSALRDLITIPDSIRKGFATHNFAGYEQRRFRLQQLRKANRLRRKQHPIHKQVIGMVHGEPEEAEILIIHRQQQLKQQAKQLVSLGNDQQRVLAAMERIGQDVIRFEEGVDTQRSKQIFDSLITTQNNMKDAVGDLQKGELFASVRSQNRVVESLDEYLSALKNHGLAAQLGLLTIAVVVLWPILAPERLTVIPGPLIATVLATSLAAGLTLPVVYVDLPENLLEEISFPDWTLLQQASWLPLIHAAVALAFVASAETLLCATATDRMHAGSRTKYSQELFAQGVGNSICGLIGALPMTGVIVRSTANLRSGGKTRASAILHGVWLLLFISFFAFLLESIPTSVLAAILVYTGFRLIDPSSIAELRRFGWGEVAIYASTVVVIVTVDLLTGILAGVVLAVAKLLHGLSGLRAELKGVPASDAHRLVLSGAATFLSLPKLASRLEEVPKNAKLEVSFRQLDYIDHACIDLLQTWSKRHESTGGEVQIDWDSLARKYDEETV
jgi:MFS superfamily sulfate permease-like transporter